MRQLRRLKMSKKRKKMVREASIKPWRGLNVSILGNTLERSSMTDDEVITTVKYTADYSKFIILEDNRDVDENAVNKLVVSIKKRGQLQPIIVNDKYQVIDGQHRLDACKILGIPVAFIKSTKATIKDVVLINNTQKSWRNQDYLKTFSHSNHVNHLEYKKVVTFLKNYTLPFTVGLNLLSGALASGGATNKLVSFKNGDFKIENLDKAERWAAQLIKIKAFAPNLVKIAKFCMAFIKIQKLEGFSSLIAYEQIEKNVRKFDRCQNQEDWDEAMVRAYNYNLKKNKKRISIKKDGF